MGKRVGPGFTPWQAAKELDMPYPRVRRAIDSGDIKTVAFGGEVEIITPREIARVRGLLKGDSESEPPLQAAE